MYNREDSNRDRINYFTIDFRNQAGTNDAVSYTFTGAQVWGYSIPGIHTWSYRGRGSREARCRCTQVTALVGELGGQSKECSIGIGGPCMECSIGIGQL